MNIYDDKYLIKQADTSDIDDIMRYIREKWRKDHILGNNRDFFEYEHCTEDAVNFYIARLRENGEIVGIIGYLYCSNSSFPRDIWTVMWMVDKGCVPLLGTELFSRLKNRKDIRHVIGVGDNKNTTVRILKSYFRFFAGKLNHYYMLGKRDEYKIAGVKYVPIKEQVSIKKCACIKECNAENIGTLFDFTSWENSVPYKDEWYFVHRYIEHPIYSYKVYSLYSEELQSDAILVTREQYYNNDRILRIIDYYGDTSLIEGLRSFFEELLDTYEYIDFYCLGIDDGILYKAGFSKVFDGDENIIPDYFNPYECRNIDIYCTSSYSKTLFCKGDADQDRPN